MNGACERVCRVLSCFDEWDNFINLSGILYWAIDYGLRGSAAIMGFKFPNVDKLQIVLLVNGVNRLN